MGAVPSVWQRRKTVRSTAKVSSQKWEKLSACESDQNASNSVELLADKVKMNEASSAGTPEQDVELVMSMATDTSHQPELTTAENQSLRTGQQELLTIAREQSVTTPTQTKTPEPSLAAFGSKPSPPQPTVPTQAATSDLTQPIITRKLSSTPPETSQATGSSHRKEAHLTQQESQHHIKHIAFQEGEQQGGQRKSVSFTATGTHRRTTMANKVARAGITGEKTRSEEEIKQLLAKATNTDENAQRYIQTALKQNKFLKNFNDEQLESMSAHMCLKHYHRGEKIIRQGEEGNELFVLINGEVSIIKDGTRIVSLRGNEVFGEIALLHKQPRNATVEASTEVKAWVLVREIFQAINQWLGRKNEENLKRFLRSTGKFPESNFSDVQLGCIAAALREVSYDSGDLIIKQGDEGDNFYIIKEGTVIVSQHGEDGQERDLRELGAGTPFGELWRVDQGKTGGRRTATIRAKKNVVCFMLEMTDFLALIGAQSFTDTVQGDLNAASKEEAHLIRQPSVESRYESLGMESLKKVRTLGAGAFGRVLLVICPQLKQQFALKCMSKCNICRLNQQKHIFNERDILLKVRHNNIVRLYRTYKDNFYVYLLMEPILGGDLFSVLQSVYYSNNGKRGFEEEHAKFYIACNVLAFDYLHRQNIAYRDLKPENLMLDSKGYCKVVDFGFAKTVCGTKTYTFCGTPEYMAPEVIMGTGHNISADLWSLGILIFECLTGYSPFPDMDVPTIQNNVRKNGGVGRRPDRIGIVAFDLINSLCREKPSRRMGSTGKDLLIKASRHRWFSGFQWNALQDRQYPDIPNMSHIKPVRVKLPSLEKPEEETSGWDKEF